MILFVASEMVIGIFLKDATLIQIGSEMLRWQIIGTVCVGVVQLLTVLFQATGKVFPSFILSLSRQGVVFLVVIVLCASLFGYQGIIVSQAVADLLSAWTVNVAESDEGHQRLNEKNRTVIRFSLCGRQDSNLHTEGIRS